MDLSPIVSAVASLGGVMLGTSLGGRRERRNWRRDKVFDVFTTFTSAARTFLWRAAEIDEGRRDLTLDEQHERLRTAMFDLREALARLELVGDEPVRRAARDIEGHYGNTLYPWLHDAEGRRRGRPGP